MTNQEKQIQRKEREKEAFDNWRAHPISVNFYEGVQDHIDFYKALLGNLNADFKDKEVARIIGVRQGLEALLTYEPEFAQSRDDEEGVILDDCN